MNGTGDTEVITQAGVVNGDKLATDLSGWRKASGDSPVREVPEKIAGLESSKLTVNKLASQWPMPRGFLLWKNRIILYIL